MTEPSTWDVVGTAFQGPVQTHGSEMCRGTHCAIHNPSDHPMREFPLYFRMDRGGLAERVCPHGVGHPDPDSLDHYARHMALDVETFHEERAWLGVHGCCGFGCCGIRYPEESDDEG